MQINPRLPDPQQTPDLVAEFLASGRTITQLPAMPAMQSWQAIVDRLLGQMPAVKKGAKPGKQSPVPPSDQPLFTPARDALLKEMWPKGISDTELLYKLIALPDKLIALPGRPTLGLRDMRKHANALKLGSRVRRYTNVQTALFTPQRATRLRRLWPEPITNCVLLNRLQELPGAPLAWSQVSNRARQDRLGKRGTPGTASEQQPDNSRPDHL